MLSKSKKTVFIHWAVSIFLLPVILFTTFAGCASQPQDKRDSLALLNSAYEAEQYSAAFSQGEALYNSSRGQTRDHVAYITGLCAFQLNQPFKVRQYLQPLINNTNPLIAGNSAATLGLSELQAAESNLAAEHLIKASELLKREDKAKACYYAGLAYQQMGRTSAARTQFIIAMGASKDSAFKHMVQAELNQTGFTIQLGLFREYENAERIANDFNATNAAKDLGQARIVTVSDDAGRTIYQVQVGRFQSMQSADRARNKITMPSIVTTLGTLN